MNNFICGILKHWFIGEINMSEYNEDLTKDVVLSLASAIDNLHSRVLGLDVCVKGLALAYILDGGSYEDKIHKGEMLKEMLLSLRTGLESQDFMRNVDKAAFFSSAQGLITSIDDIAKQLSKFSSQGETADGK